MKNKIANIKSKFIKLAVQEAMFSGFSPGLLTVVESKMELAPGYSAILFENGIKDLVLEYEELQNSLLAKPAPLDMRVRDKVALGVKTRLEGDSKSNKIILGKLLKFYAHPLNIGLGLKHTWHSVDAIWRFAGDESTDYNYYTKRSLLFAVYSSTLIYYLSDESKNHQNTWEFLDKRIASVLKIGNLKNWSAGLTKLKNKIPFIRLIK